DDNYKSPDNISCGISLFHVNGVMIQGCSFADNRTGTQAYRPDGIGSLDAGYTVVGIDLNPGTPSAPNVDHYYDETDYIVSTFSNLKNGIQAMSSNTLFPIKVDHAKFENCATGVLVDAMDNVVITRNKFDKNTNYHLENPTMLQLVFRNATGYTIEGNLFGNTHSLGGSGTAIYNSGQENNVVYRNKFNGLTENNYANGFNSNDLSDANSKGLSWKCNEMANGRYDLMDFVASYSSAPDGEGVKLMQGSASAPTGNIFSSSITSGVPIYDRHINHIDLDVMKYYYNTSAEKPTEVSGNVTEIWSSTTKKCPSSFEPTIGEISKELSRVAPDGSDPVRSVIKNIGSAISDQTNALQDLLSKGNRPQLYELLAGINESNRAVIHKTLMSESPYLSASLLEQLGQTDAAVYPRDWYRDLLLANIEATTDKALMQTLNAGAFNMPAPYLRDIEKARTTATTERGKKEMSIVTLTEKKNALENLAVSTLLTDSVAINWMDVAQLIRDNDRELKDMDLVHAYFSQNNINAAIAALDSLEQYSGNYQLIRTAKDVQEFGLFNRYLLSITGNTGKVQTLQAGEIAELSRMAASFQGKAARLAQNTLCFFTGQCDPPRVVYDLMKEDITANPALRGGARPGVYPNPNTGVFTLVVLEGSEIAGIVVTDMTGKQYAANIHPLSSNTCRLELKNPENGLYLVRTSCKDGSVYTNKIVIAQ
ncbi:MAG TPA: T9SS type A sorting domain-containing protein, partial [Chitinophagaceae bacterium]|nr:T9SS type A sorting domain-containing protein [Chitinophagaceae bacterium]